MSRTTISFAALFMTFAACATHAYADQPNQIERATFSAWTYEYETPNGNTVTGECFWENAKGEYTGGGVNGKFSSVSLQQNSNGTVTVKGNWTAQNVTGKISFTIASDKTAFTGTYTIDGQNGSWPWSGKQTYGYGKYFKDMTNNRYYCKCYFRKSNGSYDHCWCTWYPGYGNRCYWCLKDFTYWGCCKKTNKWWRWGGTNWSSWQVPKCQGCPWRCWCFPPPPNNDSDIPNMDSNIPAPPDPEASVFS